MNPDFKKLQYFLKVAETLNFSKAAEELYISTQALSKNIQMLEDELKMPLFECTTRKVKLTEYGEELRKNFLPVSEDYKKACNKMEAYLLKKKKTIRIGFFQAISKKEVVNPIILFLKALDRELHIEVIAGELDEVNHWLASGVTDLSITNIHQFEVFEHANIVEFCETPAQIVVSLYHPWMVKEKVTKKDLAELPFLLIKREMNLDEDGYCRNIRGKELHYVTNFNSLLANLETDNHFAVMPKLFESMKWSSLHYIDLPEDCRFNFKMVAMYSAASKFKDVFDQLQTLAEEKVINLI
jgi:DNA-binding transcriptional LysR family regulator